MAVIELDLAAQPDPPLSSPPPAYRYRVPGLLLVAVLALALGGAAPAVPTMWRFLGQVPAGGGADSTFQLAGGKIYTVALDGTDRLATAWTVAWPPRKLWTARFSARVIGPAEVRFGGLLARQAGDMVLLSDGPATTAVEVRTGAVRWTSRAWVDPLAGGRYGVVREPVFRPGTVYDQASGDPGPLYLSATGEPHVEPPLRTEVRALDLRTGDERWQLALPGSVSVFVAPGPAPAVLILSADRVERLSGETGAVDRRIELPRGYGPDLSGGRIVGDLLLVAYGDYQSAGHEAAYTVDTLELRWRREVPAILFDPPRCDHLICAGPRAALDVIDPVTGRTAWRAPAGVDLARQAGYVVEYDEGTGAPERLADPATGAVRVPLDGWTAELSPDPDLPVVLRMPSEAGRSVFGTVLAGRDRVQVLGETSGPISDCTADRSHVVCRGLEGLLIWAYRA
jgi:outer membrane protein assembly factor BamB